jgi:glycerol-3-phosphate dehydrogenase (NAD(P)+)
LRISVLGAGQMGTAFGAPAMERGHEVRFWGPAWIDGPALDALSAGEPHPDLEAALPGRPAGTTTVLEEAVEGAELCVVAVVSEGLGWVSERAARAVPEGVPVLVLTKGFAREDGAVVPVGSLAQKAFGGGRPVVGVGGPVKAAELIRGLPTHTVFASELPEAARRVAAEVGTGYYVPTATDDLAGVELCAALKNCYAIAVNLVCGAGDGANLRSLAFGVALGEMHRIVIAAGGRPETVAGAAGAGDLYVTCLTGRNGDFGRLLGEGHAPEEARRLMDDATVEGLGALPEALELARSLGLGEESLPLLSHLDRALRSEEARSGGLPLARLVSA